MNTLASPNLQAACAALGSLWFAGFWQGLLLLGCAAMLLRAQPRLAPRVRYCVWCAGYLAAAALPLLERLAAPAAPAMPGASATSAPFVLDTRWALLCAGLWAAGSLVACAQLITGLCGIRRLLRSAVPAGEQDTAAYAELLHFPARGHIRLLISDEIAVPAALGLGHPAIVLPRAMLHSLDREQLEQVLRHEQEHLRRYDDWTALLRGCLHCLLPLQPALLYFERHMAATREMACDDAVLGSVAPRLYARNLTEIAAASMPGGGRLLLPNLLGTPSQLGRRVDHILAVQRESASMARRWRLGAGAALLGVSALLLHSPALVAFQTAPATLAAAESPVSIPLRPASFHRPGMTPAPIVRRAGFHKIRPVLRKPHLLTIASRAAVQHEATPIPPPTVFVLWHPMQPGSGTVVFAFRMREVTPGTMQPGFFLLGI